MPSKKDLRELSNQIALNRASEFSEYHDIFSKYKNRKKLKPWEKGLITKKYKKLAAIGNEYGGLNFLMPAPKKITNKLKKENKTDLLVGGFNLIRLNNYNDGKTLDINEFGDLVQKRKYSKAGRDDLDKGRNFTFVFVDCNFDFSNEEYNWLIESGDIYDEVKEVVLKRYWDSYNVRKKKMPKQAEFYLWGKQGVLYKRAASTFELLMRWLDDWIELYLDRVIDAGGALSDELQGWCYHSNIRIKAKGGDNAKKKNSSSRRRNRSVRVRTRT